MRFSWQLDGDDELGV